MDLAIIGLAALLLLGGKRRPPGAERVRELEAKIPNAPQVPATPDRVRVLRDLEAGILPTKATTPPEFDAIKRRANGKRAADWIPHLVAQGAAPELARGLARWIGIESSGNPLAVSPIGERGLLQATKTTAQAEKLFTRDEWDSLVSPNTPPAEHARLALKQFGYHVLRARKWVANPPPASDVASWLYYAKAHHTRPRDLTADKVHGPASQMNSDLLKRHQGDVMRTKRLYSAAAVAFNGLHFGGPNV